MTTYRAGLVGCGRIGTLWETDPPRPLTHAGAMVMVPQIELVAGASRGRKHLETFGRQWGVSALYTDYREMIEREKLDIVSIATHPGIHKDIVQAATDAGVKAIFCEKPMALDLVDADAIVEACQRAGCILSVNHSRRWHPGYRKARDLLEQGVIGDLISMYGMCQGAKPYPAWQSEHEGPMLHDAVHLFDLFRFFGGDVASVTGTALKRQQPYRVEDDDQIIFEFARRASAVALVNELTRYARLEIELHGTTGMMRLSDKGNWLWTSVELHGHRREPDPNIEWYGLESVPFPEYPAGNPLLDAVQEVVDCLDTGVTPSSTGEDGRASIEMCMAVYESQLRGNARVDLPMQKRTSPLLDLREQGML